MEIVPVKCKCTSDSHNTIVYIYIYDNVAIYDIKCPIAYSNIGYIKRMSRQII